jgi:hypothetical protein
MKLHLLAIIGKLERNSELILMFFDQTNDCLQLIAAFAPDPQYIALNARLYLWKMITNEFRQFFRHIFGNTAL